MKPEVARAETERLMRDGCHVLVGAFNSSDINAIIQAIKQATKPVPLMIDIGSADQLTQQGVKYVFRAFTTSSTLGRNGIEFLMQLFKDTGDPCKRAVFLHVSDLFGQTGRERTVEWHKKLNAPFEIADIITYPVTTQDLSTEVAKAKAAKPDLIMAITRPTTPSSSCRSSTSSASRSRRSWARESGLLPADLNQGSGQTSEYLMANAPWSNPKAPLTPKVAADYQKRFGDQLTTESAWAYQGSW